MRQMELSCHPRVTSWRLSGVVSAALLAIFALSSCQEKPCKNLERADLLAVQGRYEEAVYVLDELLASLSDPLEPELDALRLEALEKAGRISHLFLRRPDTAAHYYGLVVELFPGSDQAFDSRQKLSRIHLEAGDRAGAIAHYQALVAGFPERDGLDGFQYELARAYFALGDMEQARTECESLLERWPDSEYADRVRMLIASAYYLQGHLEEAVDACGVVREQASCADLAAHALFEQAGTMAALGRNEEAIEAYLEALAIHPEPRLVRLRLERLRTRVSRRDIANLSPAW